MLVIRMYGSCTHTGKKVGEMEIVASRSVQVQQGCPSKRMELRWVSTRKSGIREEIQQGFPSKRMELKWVSTRKSGIHKEKSLLLQKPLTPPVLFPFPIFISTNPSHINLEELRDLYSASNHSCHRFPSYVGSDGKVEPVNVHKLRIALSHSSVVVSVFCKPTDIPASTKSFSSEASEHLIKKPHLVQLFQKVMPVTPFNGQLVGFGRAVSDFGLTASIYDIMVTPSLRRMGIGRLIVKRLVRMIASRDVYDIAALCSEDERLFFEACGFGDDILGSTTMMYSRKASRYQEGDQIIIRAGRKLLLAPPLRESPQ